jgi:hypothetical protein
MLRSYAVLANNRHRGEFRVKRRPSGPWKPPDNEAEYARALKRVGETLESRARWLLSLANQEALADLSEPEQRGIRWEMAVFCGDRANPEVGAVLRVTEVTAERWHSRIKEGLRRLAKGRAWGHALVTHMSLWIPLQAQWEKLKIGRPDTLYVTRTDKESLMHAVCAVILAVENRLRRCRRSTCGRLFLRRKRQAYCSPRCSSVARMRRYRHRKREQKAGQAPKL